MSLPDQIKVNISRRKKDTKIVLKKLHCNLIKRSLQCNQYVVAQNFIGTIMPFIFQISSLLDDIQVDCINDFILRVTHNSDNSIVNSENLVALKFPISVDFTEGGKATGQTKPREDLLFNNTCLTTLHNLFTSFSWHLSLFLQVAFITNYNQLLLVKPRLYDN